MAEGIALTLPILPAEPDLQDLVERIADAIGDRVDYRGAHVVRDSDLAMYFYGIDAEEMWARIEPVIAAHPLGRDAHVVLRCGHPDGKPRHAR